MLPILPCQPAQSRWDPIARIAVVTCLTPKALKVTSFFEYISRKAQDIKDLLHILSLLSLNIVMFRVQHGNTVAEK